MKKEAAITHSINVVLSYYKKWLNGWLSEIKENPKKYLVLTYEKLNKKPLKTFKEISDFSEISLSNDQIKKILFKINKKKNFSSKIIGQRSTFHRAEIGVWRDELTTSQKNIFKRKMGKLLKELGYD